jgi:hypothetical protein
MTQLPLQVKRTVIATNAKEIIKLSTYVENLCFEATTAISLVVKIKTHL